VRGRGLSGKRARINPAAALAAGVLLSVLSLVIASAAGSVAVPPLAVARIILERSREALSLGALAPRLDDVNPAWAGIVWNLRLPRALLAWLSGAALSVSGAVMQSTLRNPLASAYTLGVSSGASLGAGLVIVGAGAFPALAPLTGLSVPAAGFLFGLLSIALVMRFSRAVDPRLDNATIILSGMVFSLFVSAALTVLSALSGKEINRLVFWQMGSFALKGWAPLPTVALFFVLSLAALLSRSRELDLLSFGEDEASAIGVSAGLAKTLLVGLASVLAGIVVAFAGVIGFIDLAVPHAVRRAAGPSHAVLLPLSALMGGSLMTLADLAARTALPPLDLPVGAVTALFGAPFFAWVFFASRREGR